jgi:hypothetical protein
MLSLVLAVACTPVTTAPAPTPTPSPSPTPTPSPSPSPTTSQQAVANFEITLPPTWRQIQMDTATLDAALNSVSARDPQMAAVLSAQVRSMVASGIAYFAFDFEPVGRVGGFVTNLNVLRTAVPAGVSLAFIADSSVAQLEQLSAVSKPIARRKVTLQAGESEELRFQMSQGAAVVASTQYLFVTGPDLYVLTFSTTAEQSAAYVGVFEGIARSFRLVR